MPKVSIRQIKDKQLIAIARQHAVVLDQTPEKGGTDLGFTPTELILLALGSCMTYNLLHYAHRNNLEIKRLEVELSDEVDKSPERISKIKAQIQIAGDLNAEEMIRLMRSAQGCKIHNTLSVPPQIEVSISQIEKSN